MRLGLGETRGDGLIKIGIEATSEKLRQDLLSHPARYFFIRVLDGQPALCIRTCNSEGEDWRSHALDGLVHDGQGNLVSVFAEDLHRVTLENGEAEKRGQEDDRGLSSALEDSISHMPDFIDWMISSVLKDGRHLLLFSSWST
jgi:hypothetical protein